MKRLIAIAFAALALSACTTTPTAAPAPVVSQTTVDLLLALRAKELELERLDKMAMIKFAVESNSEFAKGMIAGGMSAGGSKAQSGTTQSIMQAQAQADATALRREEMAYANSWDRRLLPYVSLGLDFARFDRNLDFQRFSTVQNNEQQRYTFDTLRQSQQDGYAFGSNAYTAGSAATLSGIGAVAP